MFFCAISISFSSMSTPTIFRGFKSLVTDNYSNMKDKKPTSQLKVLNDQSCIQYQEYRVPESILSSSNRHDNR